MSKPTGDAAARYERLSHSGTTWYDLMPTPANGTDGTIGAAFTWPQFNGESFVDLGAPAKLDFTGAFTLCVWGNMDIVTPPVQGTEAMIYKGGRDDPAGNYQNAFMGIADTNGQATFAIYKPGYSGVQSGAGYGGVWHYFVFVNEGVGGDTKAFIDGALISTTAGGGGAATMTGTVPWYFGRTHAQVLYATDDFYQGLMDTGRFYSRALSPDEILRDYHAGKPAHL